jgi:hypothetical protein
MEPAAGFGWAICGVTELSGRTFSMCDDGQPVSRKAAASNENIEELCLISHMKNLVSI